MIEVCILRSIADFDCCRNRIEGKILDAARFSSFVDELVALSFLLGLLEVVSLGLFDGPEVNDVAKDYLLLNLVAFFAVLLPSHQFPLYPRALEALAIRIHRFFKV